MTSDRDLATSTQLTVQVFGVQAELVAARTLDLTLPGARVTAGEVLTAIAETYPALRASIGVSRLAVDHEFASATQVIPAGSEVALIGLVGGG